MTGVHHAAWREGSDDNSWLTRKGRRLIAVARPAVEHWNEYPYTYGVYVPVSKLRVNARIKHQTSL